jgi:hypothetical protein
MFVGRSGFSRDPLRHREPGVRSYRSGFHCDPCAIEVGGSGRKPLLQKPSFCRSGFSRDPCVIENQGFGVYRSGFHCDPCVIEGGGSGRKPLLQKPSFCRSGFSRDSLRHREPGVRSLSERLPLRPLRHRKRGFGAEDRGSSSRRTGDGVEGNCPQLPCLNPMAQREGGGLCPSPIIQGHEPGGLSSEFPEDYHQKGLNPRRRRRGMRRAARSVVRRPGGWAPGRRTMAWLCEEARAGWSRRQRIELSAKERERCAKPSPSRSAIW